MQHINICMTLMLKGLYPGNDYRLYCSDFNINMLLRIHIYTDFKGIIIICIILILKGLYHKNQTKIFLIFLCGLMQYKYIVSKRNIPSAFHTRHLRNLSCNKAHFQFIVFVMSQRQSLVWSTDMQVMV